MPMTVRRRELMAAFGGAMVWPLAARAQQTGKVPRVGILSPAPSEAAATLAAFREAIHDLGYIEGKTIALDFRLSKGNMDALPALAAELARIPVNIIVTDTTTATVAAFGVTRTIPIVTGASGGDPVALGMAKSLSRPGGNVTGTYLVTLTLRQAAAIAQARVSRHPARRFFGKFKGNIGALRSTQGGDRSRAGRRAPSAAHGRHARGIARPRSGRAIGW
jgi:ABC transporter substrate binding protein